ncbi:hypothetical protein PG994_009985 [Apiospora phragmitis]|uniref:Uncharacterized protein n=1 Tax=Apiospora phragmitis TaxID=2905665 RepID=A0ABR1TNL5_9PEZI
MPTLVYHVFEELWQRAIHGHCTAGKDARWRSEVDEITLSDRSRVQKEGNIKGRVTSRASFVKSPDGQSLYV